MEHPDLGRTGVSVRKKDGPFSLSFSLATGRGGADLLLG
jgi:hypothetical protein